MSDWQKALAKALREEADRIMEEAKRKRPAVLRPKGKAMLQRYDDVRGWVNVAGVRGEDVDGG